MKGIRRFLRLEHWHVIAALMVIYDLVAVNFAYFLALWLRFDCSISAIKPEYMQIYLQLIPVNSIFCMITFVSLRMYKSIWRFASYNELMRVLGTTLITAVCHVAATLIAFTQVESPHSAMPISYYFIGAAMQCIFVLGIRFSYRFVLMMRKRNRIAVSESAMDRVMLVGAGNAGQMILQDINHMSDQKMRVVCIVDDNPNKWGRYIQGVPVVGGRDVILEKVKEFGVRKIFVAIPSASSEEKSQVLNICKESGCEIKNLPGMYQIVSGQVALGDMQDVAVEDLLGRKPITVNDHELHEQIQGKTVLVTGGGGSIGSELCRQVAKRNPKQLIIFDVYENNAYDIQQELREKYPELSMVVLIGSVRDSRRIDRVFAEYHPDIVYHAAAHKHVPLMEDSPCEAVKNNVIGTYKTAYAALCHGCDRFVLISTDKAVNPTNIMGASKRLCEMIIQSFARAVQTGNASHLPELYTHQSEYDNAPVQLNETKLRTQFVAVRFGNVLGSNGSVIPLFKKQIAKGGPVRVTHPEIIRYFMTIPEAVSLVMEAGIYANGGEIFVLDMGAPVKIDELARNLIKLSGLRPDVDIPIVYTGLRPGEKLYEEKLMAEEGLQKTSNALIHIGNPIPFDVDTFLVQLKQLMDAAYDNDQGILELVGQMVPTYHPEEEGQKDSTFEKLSREASGTTVL